MRKLQRSVIRHRAEAEMKHQRKLVSKSKDKKIGFKTINAFRYLWKQSRVKNGAVYAGNVEVKQRPSMFHRAVESIKNKRDRGMSR